MVVQCDLFANTLARRWKAMSCPSRGLIQNRWEEHSVQKAFGIDLGLLRTRRIFWDSAMTAYKLVLVKICSLIVSYNIKHSSKITTKSCESP